MSSNVNDHHHAIFELYDVGVSESFLSPL